jgi:hypothetical protein
MPIDSIPSEMRNERRWVTWTYQPRGQKSAKPAKRPHQKVNIPSEWLSFAEAVERRADDPQVSGIGFVLGAGVVGLDLDDCIAPDGTLHEIARDAISLGSYVERSPSGHGLHLFMRGAIMRPRKIGSRDDVPGREVYDGRKGSARYLTVTGDGIGDARQLASGPAAQAALDAFIAKWFSEEHTAAGSDDGGDAGLDDDALLRVMFDAKDGAKWRRLFDGDHSDYASQSEADLALCGKLRFYSHGNAAQMDRLFRRSGLMRSKWDELRDALTYGKRTIGVAVARGGPCYSGSARESTARDREDCAKRDKKERTAWAKVPLWWPVRLGGAGELALRVLAVIASYADKKGEAFPSVATIASHLRVTERRVKTALKTLKATGILTIGKRGRSNLYRLALTVPETITPYAVERRALKVSESGHLGCRPHGTRSYQELTIIDTGGVGGNRLRKTRSRKTIGNRDELATQALLRRGLFPQTSPAQCDFYCGHALDDRCRRCGASWVAHYSAASEEAR